MGKIKIEKGTIQFLRAHNILLPVRSLFKLMESLKERIGEGETEEILREVGRFQIKQALVRYTKVLGIEKIEKETFKELGREILKILGYGEYEIIVNYKEKMMYFKSDNAPIPTEYKEMYGLSEEPIDYYLCGMLEEVGHAFFGIPMKCVETKCIACGDPYCQFEVFPVEEKKETKT